VRRRIARTTLAVAALALASVTSAALSAPPSGPSGSIELASPATLSSGAWPQYGDTIGFDVTLDGKLDGKARIYVTVVCLQGDTAVYQVSGDPNGSFTLSDTAGLEWDGGAASCIAALAYRLQKGNNIELTYLDETTFAVAGA
jgi:hypothetical protein